MRGADTLTDDEYIREILRAREAHLSLDPVLTRQIVRAVSGFAADLEQIVAREFGRSRWAPRYRRALLGVVNDALDDLQGDLEGITRDGIQLSAGRVAQIADGATVQMVGASTFVAPGNLRAGSAFAARAAAVSDFKTLLAKHTANAGGEIEYVLTRGITERVGPEELARRLRGYVEGSQRFGSHVLVQKDSNGDVVGRKIDLRRLSRDERGAARQMLFNAERIAHTEHHNAAHETLIRSQEAAPMVEASEWNISPDRGRTLTPDECDFLAAQDAYSMGPGVYPVEAVPYKPHPFDRCWMTPVMRPQSEWGSAKPRGEYQGDPSRTLVSGPTGRQKRGARKAAEVTRQSRSRELRPAA